DSLFQNKAADYAFEPGSVTKVLTMAAAINVGAVTPDTTYHNSGCVQIADAKICNSEPDRVYDGETLSMTNVLKYSLNTGAVFALQQIGGGQINSTAKNTLYDYFHNHYRLDQASGIEQENAGQGMIYKPTDVQGGAVNYANMTFGQGFQTTMVQELSALSAIVNGGTYYQPHLVAGTLDDDNKLNAKTYQPVQSGVVKSSTAASIRSMMETTYQRQANGYHVGAKSGTAQIYDPTTGKYSTTLYTGTYMGFGADASDTPRYDIMVRVDGTGLFGYQSAQPIFGALSNWIINYEGISK
ncbi:MAG: hypothetical protein LBM73_00750, partial [Candidatus Nomurabacteria bacterium]|nr:hypothetical protein [Candidatus Nomurabacteria bacterium]